jgi:glycosyltransferase involved in cell wall biosynthesis
MEQGVLDALLFVGQHEKPEIWMRRAQILAMPSEWEGLPYAMIEAMRCGVVPVVTAVGSIEDLVVDDDNGRILRDSEPQTIADAIAGLLDDREVLDRLSARAVETTQSLTYTAVSDVWRAIFQSLGVEDG